MATVSLNRPDVRNALNAELIGELSGAFKSLANEAAVRAVVLTGAGKSFCAGADLNYMKEMARYGKAENEADAKLLSDMFAAIRACPKPVIARVNGAAMGGGVGLVAVSDIAIAGDTAQFGFTEVKLGLVPSVISPYVVERIGSAPARRLFMTGERFEAKTAEKIGLVDLCVPDDVLDSIIKEQVRALLSSGPKATGEAKKLVEAVCDLPKEEMRQHAIRKIAELRGSPEGQEGMAAFLEKRIAKWSDR